MNTCIYTNRGEEVPLGVECALPGCAGSPLQDDGMPAEVGTFLSRWIQTVAAHPLTLAEAKTFRID